MLVLSRKIGERILIGNGIVVTLLEIRGRQVRLGIEAPVEVPIWRGEISLFDNRSSQDGIDRTDRRQAVETVAH